MDPSREPGPECAETEEEGRLDSHDLHVLQPARQQRGEGLKSMILILICVTDCSIKEFQ